MSAQSTLSDQSLFKDQNSGESCGELYVNADGSAIERALFATLRRALVLQRGVIVRRFVRVTGEPVHAQQPRRADNGNGAAGTRKASLSPASVSSPTRNNTAPRTRYKILSFFSGSLSFMLHPLKQKISSMGTPKLRDLVRQQYEGLYSFRSPANDRSARNAEQCGQLLLRVMPCALRPLFNTVLHRVTQREKVKLCFTFAV